MQIKPPSAPDNDAFDHVLQIAAEYVAEIPALSQYHNAESSDDWLDKLREYARQRATAPALASPDGGTSSALPLASDLHKT